LFSFWFARSGVILVVPDVSQALIAAIFRVETHTVPFCQKKNGVSPKETDMGGQAASYGKV
jgi:hypothetical protein